ASAGGGHVGAVAASVYWSNTVGAIAGSLAGGFALLPWLGLHGSLRATAAIGIVAAVAIWAADARDAAAAARGWVWRGAVAAASALPIVLLPAWNPQLLASGAYKYAPYIGVADLETDLQTWKLRYLKDGA